MFVKVKWGNQSPASYKVWECQEYFVEITGWSGSSKGDSTPSSMRLMLDNGKHDIQVSEGDEVFIMNNEGRTIDVIRTV